MGAARERTYTINPLVVQLSWDGYTTRTFDGTASNVTATVSNAVTGHPVTVNVIGGGAINAGNHTATADDLSNANYILPVGAAAQRTYTISHRIVTLTWNNVGDRDFDGNYSNVTVAVGNLIGSDAVTLGVSNGTQRFAGTHRAEAYTVLGGLNAANYTLVGTASSRTQDYTINQLLITLQWAGHTGLVFDNTAKNVTASMSNYVSGFPVNIVVTGGTETFAGNHEAEATGLSGDYAANFILPVANTQSYTIGKAPAPTGTNGGREVIQGRAYNFGFGLMSLLPITTVPGLTGMTFSPVIFTDIDSILSPLSYTTGDTLNISVLATSLEGNTATIRVTISSTNHDDFTAYITITIVDKSEVTISGVTAVGGTFNGNTHAGYTGTYVVEDESGNPVSVTLERWYRSTDGGGHNSAEAPRNAGAYRVYFRVPEANANYIGEIYLDFTIAKLVVTLSWSGAGDRTFDGEVSTVTATAVGLVTGFENVTVNVADGNAVNAGSHTAEAMYLSGAHALNYQLPDAGAERERTYTINALVVTLSWSGAGDRTFNGVASSVTATVSNAVNGHPVTVVTVEGGDAVNAGTHTATVTALSNNPNYVLPAAGAARETLYTINALEVTFTWDGYATRTFDGTASNVTATVFNAINGHDVTVTVGNGTQTNAGTHTATATALSNPNYALPAAGADAQRAYTINRANGAGTPTVNAIDNIEEGEAVVVAITGTRSAEQTASNMVVEFSVSGANVWTTTEPETVGEWDVRVRWNDSTNYLAYTIPGIVTFEITESSKEALTGTATISNTSPRVGDTLTASITGTTNVGSSTPTFSWYVNGVFTNVTTATFEVLPAHEGYVIKVYIRTADHSFYLSAETDEVEEAQQGPATLTGTATIDNMNPRLGDTLTATLVGGNNTGTLSFQWYAGPSAIDGATANTFVVTSAQLNAVITVRISSSVETGDRTSDATAAVRLQAGPDAPAAPTFVSRTHNSVTLTPNAAYEFSSNGTTWQNGNTLTGLEPNIEYTFFQRVRATTTTEASASSAGFTQRTYNTPPATPAAPEVYEVTSDSVTLVANANMEFSRNGTTWQPSNVFTGLTFNTLYSFHQRVRGNESENMPHSAASAATNVTTEQGSAAEVFVAYWRGQFQTQHLTPGSVVIGNKATIEQFATAFAALDADVKAEVYELTEEEWNQEFVDGLVDELADVEIETFPNRQEVLAVMALNPATITLASEGAINRVVGYFNALQPAAQAELTEIKTHLDALVSAIDAMKQAELVVTGIELHSRPLKTVYGRGEALDVTGLVIRITRQNNTQENVNVTLAMVSGFDPNKRGVQTLTITYAGRTTTFEVTVEGGCRSTLSAESYTGTAVLLSLFTAAFALFMITKRKREGKE
jgi:hypothetical protein